MSVGLLVERRSKDGRLIPIQIEEWRTIVGADPQLRMRTEPYRAVNPKTLQELVIQIGEADSEILVEGDWHPFLRLRRGSLKIEYGRELENPENQIRKKIVQVAHRLNAVVRSDAGGEIKNW